MKGAVLVAMAVLLAGCATGTPRTSTRHDVHGTLTVANAALGGICVDQPGYADIRAGAPVTLRDEGGTIIGTGTLGPGAAAGGGCEFAFTIPAVPERPFYSVEVSHRGQVTSSLADLAATGWRFALSLGP